MVIFFGIQCNKGILRGVAVGDIGNFTLAHSQAQDTNYKQGTPLNWPLGVLFCHIPIIPMATKWPGGGTIITWQQIINRGLSNVTARYLYSCLETSLMLQLLIF